MMRLMTFAACAALAACSAPGATVSFDGSYRLLTIDGKPIPGRATMTIAGQSVRGGAPCNDYWTANEAAWPAVRLGPVGTTRRMCYVEGGEAAFLAALEQSTAARRTADGIELTGPEHRMRFEAGK